MIIGIENLKKNRKKKKTQNQNSLKIQNLFLKNIIDGSYKFRHMIILIRLGCETVLLVVECRNAIFIQRYCQVWSAGG